jgi:isoleucyl-tRNA synthetase
MSKSIGNVIDPFQLVDLYGVDYVRYFLISEIAFGSDGDFTHEAFAVRINTDLANDIGNLLQRTTTFICKQFNSQIPVPGVLSDEDSKMIQYTDTCVQQMKECIDQQNLKGAAEAVVNIARQGNRYIDTQAPWKLIKTDVERCGTVLFVLAECMRRVGVLLQPIMPNAAKSLLDQLAIPDDARTFISLQAVGITAGTSIPAPYPIFPKIDLSKISPDVLKPTTSTGTTTSAATSASTTTATTGTTTGKEEDLTAMTAEQLAARIATVGDSIRDMKTRQASKEELKPLVDSLLALKDRYVWIVVWLISLFVIFVVACYYNCIYLFDCCYCY